MRYLLIWLAALLTACSTAVSPPTEAVSAATAWLKVVDNGEYATSWQQASTVFRGKVTERGWTSAVTPVRTPIGTLQSRRLESSVSKSDPLGAPEGEYLIMTFAATYSAKPEAVETVSMFQESDGTWKVAGYWIR